MSNSSAQPTGADALDIYGGRTAITIEGCPPIEGSGKGAAPPQAQAKAVKTKGKAAGGKGAKAATKGATKGAPKGAVVAKAGTFGLDPSILILPLLIVFSIVSPPYNTLVTHRFPILLT